ncbi:MAG: 5'-nucleotidase C-terminal domain-containing protein [Candidatus Cloacimonetes bacterium]|nr:5'-nucleotidase C-terminal domain-containing protein [Candidatus Cloacimonadota bacterium]
MKNRFLILLLLAVFSVCGAETLLIDIMFTNDIHGGIDVYPATYMNPDFPPMIGGGASAATYIQSVRKLTDNKSRANLLLDAGDFFQGHPVGTVTNGKAIIEYMNMVAYDALAIGNHEYDIKEDTLKVTLALAEFPILSCNIIDTTSGKLINYALPYIFIEKLGLKIAIIGLTTTDTEKMSFPENIAGLDFIPAKPALEKYIEIVRDEGADIVIVLGHMGLPYYPEKAYQRRYPGNVRQNLESNFGPAGRPWGYDAQELAHEVEGIDIFIGGHIHKGVHRPWVDPITHTMVVQGYAMGSNVGHLIVEIDKETKSVAGWRSPADDSILITMFQEEHIPHPEIGSKLWVMQTEAEKGMNTVIGHAKVFLSRLGSGAQNVIGNLICDIMLESTGADFSFLNLGGIRDDIPQGAITYRDVFDVLPFDNQIVLFEASGTFLKQIIEKRVEYSRHGLRVSGVEVVFSKERENNDRVTKLLIGGKPWRADATYKIATSDFLMEGNAGLTLLTKVEEKDIIRLENSMRDTVVEYIRHNSPVSSQIDKRWKRDDNAPLTPELKSELEKIKGN